MVYYVNLNAKDIVIGVSMLSGIVNNPQLVEITKEQYSNDILNRHYDREAKSFSENKYEPTSLSELADFEQLKQRVFDLENTQLIDEGVI